MRYISSQDIALTTRTSLDSPCLQAYAVIWVDEEAQETELVGERDHPATSPRVEEL